jgi:hypothetical protein
VRRTSSVLLAAVIGAIAALAVYDAVRESSPPEKSTAQGVDTETPGVVSTPPSVPNWPRVLRRTIRLERAVGAGWEEFGVLDPGSYTLTARIELPHKANVDVWIEATTSADVVYIRGPSVPRNCELRQGRDVCFARVDFVQDPGQPLRLLARKVSRGQMLIGLRIEFEKTAAG